MKSNRTVPAVLAAALAAFSSFGSLAARQPDIVIFSLDDMACAQPGVYGCKLAPTPYMDSLARSSVFTGDIRSFHPIAPMNHIQRSHHEKS